jgi:L-alanine-DL-glutamate epimerase-like enolase superfamily enzyme
MEQRRLRDRFGRTVGANSKGRVVGTGGAYQVRRIVTDKGAAGWAMSHWKPDQVKQFIGARVGDLYDVEQGTSAEAMKLDRVLDDLAGNILGMPVYKMFGAKGPASVPLYSGAIYLDDLLPEDKPRGIDGVLQSCRQDYEAGYRAFKLKIGRGFKRMPRKAGLKRDINVTRAVRRNFPKCRVLVDANDAYTVEEACTYVAAVADCDLYWIEEPFEENREALLKLHEVMDKVGCKALIAEGEGRKAQADPLTAYGGYTSEFTDRLYNLAAEKLVDVFLFDLGIVGFTRWRHIMPSLIEAGVKASPHTWMWLPRPYYAAQLAAGVGNIPIVEGIPGTTKGIDTSAYELRNGELVMPETPGFGLRLS